MLITDLSQGRIDINTRFKGAELLIFGAIQYPAGAVPDAPADIAIVVRGPVAPITVRKKARVAGIWINTDSVRFESVPGFYAVATTRPIEDLADDRTTAIYEIGVRNLQLSPVSSVSADEINRFEAGLIKTKRDAGLFAETPGAVVVTRGAVTESRPRLGGTPSARTVVSGEAFAFGPDHIHRMGGAVDGSVSIHAYSPPLWRMGQYSISDSGVMRRFSVSYADELRPI